MEFLADVLLATRPYGKNQSDYFVIVLVAIIAYIVVRQWWKKR